MGLTKIKHNAEVIIGDYPYHDSLKEEILPGLEIHPDVRKKKTNVKACTTNWWLSSPQIEKLKKYLLNELDTKNPVGVINEPTNPLVWHNFWGNIYHKGEYADPHAHSPYYYSMVYYLKSKWYHPSLVFLDSGKKISPKDGRYILFPSYLWHKVAANRFKEQRITLSGNIDALAS